MFCELEMEGCWAVRVVVAFLYVERQLLENHPTVFISTFKDLGMFCLGECSNFQIDCLTNKCFHLRLGFTLGTQSNGRFRRIKEHNY